MRRNSNSTLENPEQNIDTDRMLYDRLRDYRLILPALVILTACQQQPSSLSEPRLMPSPAAPGSTSPNLATGPDGTIVLSWISPDGEGNALMYSRLEGDVWSEPRKLVRGDNWFVNWADFPSVVPLSESMWAAHWLVSQEAGGYAYDVNLAISTDEGRTWSEPFTPHTDNTPTEHGFVTLFNDAGNLGVIWLDGRKMVNEFDPDNVGDSGMTLRAATFSAAGKAVHESLIDDLTCDCCQTDVALTPQGPLAVYRDRTTAELRDIYVAQRTEGRWQPGTAVNADRWDIAACPVNGPVIQASGRRVAVAWFTGANNLPLVNLAWSVDAGNTFSDPIEIDADRPLGHVASVMTGDGTAIVAWIRSNNAGGGYLMVRSVTESGHVSASYRVTLADDIFAFSVPQIALAGSDLILAWTTETDDESNVGTAVIPLDVLSTPAG